MKATSPLIRAILHLFVSLSCVGVQVQYASQTREKLTETLRAAQGLTPDAARELIKKENIYDDLIRSLTDAGGQDWAHPSSQRLSLAAEYGAVIAESFDALLHAATIDRASNQYDREVLEIMKFASANPIVEDILAREVSENPKFELRRNEVLLQTRGFSKKDAGRVVSSIKGASSDSRRSLLGFYSDWGLIELSPYYAELLNTEPENGKIFQSKFGNFTEGEFHASVRVAAEAFAHFGEAPSNVLERMRSLLTDYGTDVLGPQVETLLQSTIEILERKRSPALKLAANGSGPINLSVPETEPITATSTPVVSNTAVGTSLDRVPAISPTPVVSLSGESPQPESPSTLPWLIGIAVIAAIVIGAVVMRRKS